MYQTYGQFNSQIYSTRTFGQLAVRLSTFSHVHIPKLRTNTQVRKPSCPLHIARAAEMRRQRKKESFYVATTATGAITGSGNYRGIGLLHIWQNRARCSGESTSWFSWTDGTPLRLWFRLSIAYETHLHQLHELCNFDFIATVKINGNSRRIGRRWVVVVRNGMAEENCASQSIQAFGMKEVLITCTLW